MHTLESILNEVKLPERLKKVEQLLLRAFGLEGKLAELSTPRVVVHDDPNRLGAYSVSNDPAQDDIYHLNSHALNDIRVLLHEAGHRIRQKLNLAAKQYMLDPVNRLGGKLKEFYERINLEEMFAKFCEKVGLSLLGIQTYTYRINNYLSKMQKVINSPRQWYDWVTHAFGYQKEEELTANMNPNQFKQFGNQLIYSNNPAEFRISVPI